MYMRDFKSAMQRIGTYDIKRVIITDRNLPAKNSRRYNRPRTTEVGLLTVGQAFEKIDIVQIKEDCYHKRVLEIHHSYVALHYPLFVFFLARNKWLSLSPEENKQEGR